MTITILSFDEWAKKHYSFDLMADLGVLKKTELTTFSSKTRKNVINIRKKMMDSKRTLADKLTIKKYCYIHYYLMGFLKASPDNFDKLLELVDEDRPIFVQDLQMMNN